MSSMSKFEETENGLKSPTQINIMHRIDNVLLSHGGLTADYLWNDESPLWFRPQYETREIFRSDTYKQNRW